MVQENSLKKILVVCGPTASGKTSLAVECAKLLGSEVVSADSMCVYERCDVGSAKPTMEERQGVMHHMIDVVSPFDSYSVGDYRDGALPIIENIIANGKIPVVCGGTGFYINALLYDLSYGNAVGDEGVRRKYELLLKEKGKEYLHDLLNAVDARSAEVLHVNDTRRVIRALEIYEVSGKRKSDIVDDLSPRYDYVSVCVDFPRDELYSRINRRVDIMMEQGLKKEVLGLLDLGVTMDNQCMQGIGYKEVCQGINEKMSDNDIGELIKFNTRHYAKRQITFFKRDERLKYLIPEDVCEMAKKTVELLK